jgi:prepilin-type N-terminal cleavage/methylation domain-containing protein
MTRPHKSAFSLLELSITILIIGILLIGVIGAKHLIKKSRISTAQNLTSSAPISGILDNALWLESSLDYKAFSNDVNNVTSNDSGNALGDGDYIDNWNDNSYNQNKASITKIGNGPIYANTINSIQAVKFNDPAGIDNPSDENYLQIADASFLNGTDYTIFVLEKRLSNGSDNYFIGDSSVTTANQTLILGL